MTETTPETDVVVDENNDVVVEHETELSKRVEGLEAQQSITKLLQDPDVAKVLEAKRTGKTVQITTDEPEPDPTLSDDVGKLTDKLDEDDPQKALFDAITKLVDDKFALQDERLEAVELHAKSTARQAVSNEVTKARETFSDLDKYKDAMVELSGTVEGLSVVELYMLSKSRAGDLDLAKPETFTEKPTVSTTTRRAGTAKREKVRRGRKGFSDMLSEALEKIPDGDFL